MRECKLFSLERRRLRGDMIQVFKIIKGIDKINIEDIGWKINKRRTRGHNLKILKQRCRLDIRKHFFTQRIVSFWNELPAPIVALSTVEGFKKALDKYMNSIEIL